MTNHREERAAWLARLLGTDFLLWSPHIQAPGFLNWPDIFATRRIETGSTVSEFEVGDQLEIEYEHLGLRRSVEDLIRDEHLSGLLVLQGRRVLLERYALGLAQGLTWQSSSTVKSLTSTLVGAAIHDGYIGSLQDEVTQYLPELVGSAYDGVTLEHLLLMSSGNGWTEDYEDLRSDVVQKYLKPIAERAGADVILEELRTVPRLHEPGTQFLYNTGDTYLLGHVVVRATGRSVAAYCSERIWKPMGMDTPGYFMLDGDDGVEIAGSCCGASLRDYARWGRLMLRDGVAENGERILPEGWVNRATAPIAPRFSFPMWEEGNHEFAGYGYLWWVMRPGSYTALGVYGQWIHVEPAHDLVIVMIGAMPRQLYMDPSEPAAQVGGSQHGSPGRLAFIDAVCQSVSDSRERSWIN